MKNLIFFNETQNKELAIQDRQTFLLSKGIDSIGWKEVEMDLSLIELAKKHGLSIEREGDKFFTVVEDTIGKKIDKQIVCVEFKTR